MTASCPKTDTSRSVWALLLGGWLIASLVTRVMLKENGLLGITAAHSALWLKTVIALLPLIPAVLIVWTFVKDIRNADELERRLHLEALAIAFPVTVILLMGLGLLELVIDLNPNDWSYRHIWPYVMMFWLFGYFQARHRYGIK